MPLWKKLAPIPRIGAAIRKMEPFARRPTPNPQLEEFLSEALRARSNTAPLKPSPPSCLRRIEAHGLPWVFRASGDLARSTRPSFRAIALPNGESPPP